MIRRRFWVLALTPFEIVVQMGIGAWRGFALAIENAREAWEEAEGHGSW